MSLRRLIVEVESEDLNVRAFCATHGISTWFFYDLRRRFRAEGESALVARSRAPRRIANRTPVEIEDVVVALRKELVDAGLDAGPATIAWHLAQRDARNVPSESTIWRILSRRGFIVAEPTKAPKHARRCFVAARANECWQYDDTHWAVGTDVVKIINVLDDCSRLLVASTAVISASTATIFETITNAATKWGWPQRTLCDNAKAHLLLDDTFAALGIDTRHSRPYHPQTCGKVERFHQTLKKRLNAQPSPATLEELQDQLDNFRDYYNHQRPHRALARHRPFDVWQTTPKSGPSAQPLGAATDVRRLRVSTSGTISWGRAYIINIGTTHAGKLATAIVTDLNAHVFIEGRLARSLTLDTTRRYQQL